MLMIRRRCGETILVGEEVEIQVLEISGSRVKLGISAPRDILVLRKELRLARDFNQQAAIPAPLPHILSLVNQLPLVGAPDPASRKPPPMLPENSSLVP